LCRSALYKKATEKQDAQDHNDCDKDYLDQTHDRFLKILGGQEKQYNQATVILIVPICGVKAHQSTFKVLYDQITPTVQSFCLKAKGPPGLSEASPSLIWELKEPHRIGNTQSSSGFGREVFNEGQMVTIQSIAYIKGIKRDNMGGMLRGD
jgi:hypothetical protein